MAQVSQTFFTLRTFNTPRENITDVKGNTSAVFPMEIYKLRNVHETWSRITFLSMLETAYVNPNENKTKCLYFYHECIFKEAACESNLHASV